MERPVRIAFLSELASPVALLGSADADSQNVYVDEVSSNLAQRGYAVDVFTRRDDPSLPEIIDWKPGVRVIHLAAGPFKPIPKDVLLPYMPDFRAAFQRFLLYDEVHYDLLHGNSWMSGWVAIELKRQLGLPVVQIFHAMGKTKQRYRQEQDTGPDERIRVEVVRMADRLIAQCPGERNELIEDYRAAPAKVVIIPSAVNTRVFYPVQRDEARRLLGLAPDNFVVVYVGCILPHKDVRNVVRAVALLVRQLEQEQRAPRVTLMIVGGETVEPAPQATPEIDELQRLAAEPGISNYLRFTGKRRQETLRYYYSAADVVVSTPWYEPFGLTPLEAMACERPVIGSAVGGLTYTIADGETGFLVPPRAPEQVTQHLYDLYMQPELCEQMGYAARLRVEQEFTWPVVALRTSSLYKSLLDSTPQSSSQLARKYKLLEGNWREAKSHL